MKPRNREINIFNMSLLDILCGALGAFCFMMLVLFPSYKPTPQKEDPKDMVDPKTYEEAMNRIRQLEAKLNDCQSKQTSCESRTKEQEKTINRLSLRDPIVVAATFTGASDFDLYVRDTRSDDMGKGMPRINPGIKQTPFWTGDRNVDYAFGIATELWLVRDSPVGSYNVYYKLFKKAANSGPTEVTGVVLTSLDNPVALPKVTLTREGEVIQVATINMQKDSHTTVRIDVPQ